jgi:protein O-mannosyl-transferase
MKRQRNGQRGARQGSPGVTPRAAASAAFPRRFAGGGTSPAPPTGDGWAGLLARWSSRGWLPGLLLVLGTVLVYQPAWQGGFLWDDDLHITKNRMLVAPDGLKQIWSSPESPQYYPMVFTTFRIERALWGLNPTGYHWVNLLLHAASAVLVWRVLKRLNVPGAWLAGAVFALHPVNVESVAWISQRKNTLAMFFYLLSALFYLRSEGGQDAGVEDGAGIPAKVSPPNLARRGPSPLIYGLSLFVFMLALLSKTAVSPLPLVLLGLAWWRRGRLTGRDIWRSAPFFAASLLLGLLTVWFERHHTTFEIAVRDESFWLRLAAAGWAIWFYLYKAFLPLNLILIYPRWQIEPSHALSYLPGLLVIGSLLVLWWRRRRWDRAWLFCAGYYVLMLLPILGFVNIGFLSYSRVADHWQYFAIIAPIAGAAALFSSRFKARGSGFGGSRSDFNDSLSPIGLFLAVMLLVVLGGLTWRQSGFYANADALWRRTLAVNPGCWPAHYNLGVSLVRQGNLDDAIVQFHEALQGSPDDAKSHNNLGSALLHQGKADEAIAEYHRALHTDPDFADARNNLGSALLQKGEVDEAIVQYRQALQSKPDYAEAHNNLGLALLRKGGVDEAIAQYQSALQSEPDYAEAHNNLGTALVQKGRTAEAIAQYQKALQLDPADPKTQNNLALLLATGAEAPLRNGDKAVQLARQANELAGGKDPNVLRTLAAAFAEAGQFGDAVQSAQKAMALAQAAGQQDLAARLGNELKRYEAGLPLHQ